MIAAQRMNRPLKYKSCCRKKATLQPGRLEKSASTFAHLKRH